MRKPATRCIIVNADDLGRTPGVNRGIFEAHRRGIVSSATLMVAFPAAREAAVALADHPDLGVGLHVALTGGRPVLPPEAVPSLVDRDGSLPRKVGGLANAAASELRAEIRSQVERFVTLTGRQPTHLDSHHHAHRLPEVLEAVIEVAHEHGLPVRRASLEIADRLTAAGVATTAAFVDRLYGADATIETLLDILRRVGPGTTEIMCHPGYADAGLRDSSGYAIERERELSVLTDARVHVEIERQSLERATFGSL